MGNCLVVSEQRQAKVLRVVKTDGKVLEFRVPALVKDILANFPDSAGIGLSQQASDHLPPTYKMKLGKVYYVIPLPGSIGSDAAEEDSAAAIRSMKIVITKQQLQELLTKQISAQELLSASDQSGLEKQSGYSVDSSSTNWKPKLESIPEGIE